jgi:hypothetical protein
LERVKISKSECFKVAVSFFLNKNKAQQKKSQHALASPSVTSQQALGTQPQGVNCLVCNCKQNCKSHIRLP